MTECNHELIYNYTIDKVLPYGDIVSTAIFKCIKCGAEFLEGEVENDNK